MNNTKQHILKVSFRLFLQKNFKEVTMQEIVKETGLSKGAFYHYFNSKEALFFEVVENFYLSEEINNYDKLDKTSLKKFYLSYVTNLQTFIDFLKSAFDLDENLDKESNINYFTLIFDALGRFPNFKQKMEEIQTKELNIWLEVIESAIKKNEIKTKMQSKYIARMFFYSIDATFIQFILQGKLSDAISEIKNLWDNFYKQLKK
jgi:TetR/AcrR family transcriptional regulator, transcriptional repressor for nem operon